MGGIIFAVSVPPTHKMGSLVSSLCEIFLKKTIRISLEQETIWGLGTMMHVLVSEKVNNTIEGNIVRDFYNAYLKLTNLRKKMSDKLMEPSAYMFNVQGTLQPASIPKSAKTAKKSEFARKLRRNFI